MNRFVLLLLSILFASATRGTAFDKSATGIQVTIGQAHVGIAVARPGIFRLSVAFGAAPAPAPSIFLDSAKSDVSWDLVTDGNKVGMKTAAGQLWVDQTTGEWTMLGEKGEVLIEKGELATSTSNDISLQLSIAKDKPFQAYGSGNGDRKSRGLLQTEGLSHLGNGVAVIPYYWCNAGYCALGISGDDDTPARWQSDAAQGTITWTFPGKSADLYLMPAADLYHAAKCYADLTGHPTVPPKWTFGYLQSRWGWVDKKYIDDTLKKFQDDKLPVDAFIFDFECYTTKPDYALQAEGLPSFPDFTWNPLLFPDPVANIAAYRAQGIHVVPIRKPRIGDSATLQMMHAKNWVLVTGKNGEKPSKFDERGVNYENPEVRAWYADHLKEMIDDGVAGWWNDEGESSYTKYYYWNQAEVDAEDKFKPNTRHWGINRSFQPGLQRLGGAAWTGDIGSNWDVLARTPTDLLNWSLAGMPYVGCDLGGFTGLPAPQPNHPHLTTGTPPELTVRWMQEGAFLPIMRAHSVNRIPPHFPWLSGPDAENAIRKALDLRYQLIPYYYSLAHAAYETGAPLMRPLVMEFPDDPKVADLSDQWLMGPGLMAAPVQAEGGKRHVYFPDDMFVFNDTKTFKKGDETEVTAALDEIPVYVRAGTILPLGPVVENTDQLPGGSLEVQVYPGRDATFTLVEDDGVSQDYKRGAIRKTEFKWDDAARKLNWTQSGDYAGKDVFLKVHAVLFDPSGRQQQDTDLSAMGSVSFSGK